MWTWSPLNESKGLQEQQTQIQSNTRVVVRLGKLQLSQRRKACNFLSKIAFYRLPGVTVPLEIYPHAGSSGLFAPFWPRVFLLVVHPSERWMVGAVGIEPTTFGLKGRCSTTELRPYV